jgi:hypothetical protein
VNGNSPAPGTPGVGGGSAQASAAPSPRPPATANAAPDNRPSPHPSNATPAPPTPSAALHAAALSAQPSLLATGPATQIPATLSVAPAAPEPYPNARGPRPTLSQGLGTTPLLSTPAILERPDPAAGWEALLGVPTRVGNGDAGPLARHDLTNPDFWDALTGRGTGASSLGAPGVNPAGIGGADRRLLTKRKIQELVGELDGSERLEGEVEDVSARCVTSLVHIY